MCNGFTRRVFLPPRQLPETSGQLTFLFILTTAVLVSLGLLITWSVSRAARWLPGCCCGPYYLFRRARQTAPLMTVRTTSMHVAHCTGTRTSFQPHKRQSTSTRIWGHGVRQSALAMCVLRQPWRAATAAREGVPAELDSGGHGSPLTLARIAARCANTSADVGRQPIRQRFLEQLVRVSSARARARAWVRARGRRPRCPVHFL